MFYDENIDWVFEAAVEAVEEAIVSSLYHARTTTASAETPTWVCGSFLSNTKPLCKGIGKEHGYGENILHQRGY